MLDPNQFGRLVEPLSGRAWDRSEILARFKARTFFLADLGLRRHDRAFLPFGNPLEAFRRPLTCWHPGACVVLVDSRPTTAEVTTLAQSATPKVSLWNETPPEATAHALANLGVGLALMTDGDVIPKGLARTLPPSSSTLDDDAL